MTFPLQNALAARVVMFGGEEALWRRALGEFRAAAGISEDDFDFAVLTAGEHSREEWVAQVSTVPFLSERRTVMVRHLLRADPKLPPDAKGIPETGRLVLIADEEIAPDEDRVRKWDTALKGWMAWTASAGGVVYVPKVDGPELGKALAQEAGRLGKKMGPGALDALIERVGQNFGKAMAELAKLSDYVGDSPEISAADVRLAVTPNREYAIWALIGSAGEGNVGSALREMNLLLDSTKRPEDAANRSILPLLTRHLRLLLQARICLDQGERPPNLSAKTLQRLPDKHIGQEKPYSLRQIWPQAERVSYAQCVRAMERAAVADAQLKGQLPSASTRDTLETLIMDLSQILRARSRAR